MSEELLGTEIAIIGMACRFPKSKNIEEFWRNLRDGVECITFFTEDELSGLGLDQSTLREPDYVMAAPLIEGMEMFDAAFFGYSPREAALIDPQHRIFLECAFEGLEAAGYNPETFPGTIGVYGGAAINTYLLFNILRNREVVDSVDQLQINIANDKDYLTTRVSYKLNLKGPSHLVQSACSTSLVAVHVACQSLLNDECDMALAGGISMNVNRRAGYRYLEGGMASPDGHCRAFDAAAQGTIFGSGVGIVVLKRLEDALADRDSIHAVIRGSAINNDGSMKVGYTAPSVDGQAAVITEALCNAAATPDTITYVEAHGTGTPLGDPIEIQALTKAYRAYTDEKGYCAIGSVKTNVGHLDAAAGIAGLIKTVLSIKHGLIPPSLHFHLPNPNINFSDSPFFVNSSLSRWEPNGLRRRAGVSAFGVGGTNAHIILEQPPQAPPSSPSRPWQLLCLSARTPSSLEAASANLAAFLTHNPEVPLADIAFTLAVGRKAFAHRLAVVCRSHQEAIDALTGGDASSVISSIALDDPHSAIEGEKEKEVVRAVGEMWVRGMGVEWEKYYEAEERRRVEVPTYAFERQRYWIEAGGEVFLQQQHTRTEYQNSPEPPARYLIPGAQDGRAPSSNSLEEVITSIWRKELGVEQIGINDNFFDLGGDSLIALQVSAQLKKELGMEIPVVSIYEGLTIRSLVEFLKRVQDEGRSGQQQTDVAEREQRVVRRKQYIQKQRAKKIS